MVGYDGGIGTWMIGWRELSSHERDVRKIFSDEMNRYRDLST